MITEVGAVKVRGGEVLGEFQTLVNPHQAIPPFIAVLTGITDSMVAASPPIEQVLPQFLEFAQRLRPGGAQRPVRRRLPQALRARSRGGRGPRFEVLDTAKLARRVDHPRRGPQLQARARWPALFGASTTPNHRALSDARATVDVLHGLIGRLGNLGVHTLEELQTFSARVTTGPAPQAAPGRAAAARAGVYLFRDERGAGALRRDVEGPAHPGAHLLHGLRDPLPDGRDGRRWPTTVDRHRVRAPRSRPRCASCG